MLWSTVSKDAQMPRSTNTVSLPESVFNNMSFTTLTRFGVVKNSIILDLHELYSDNCLQNIANERSLQIGVVGMRKVITMSILLRLAVLKYSKT